VNNVRLIAVLVATAGLLGCVSPQPETGVYHIAPNGNDSGDGSATAPFKTFVRAFEVLQDGETLELAGGVYTEEIRLSGYTNSVTLRGGAGKTAVLRGTRPLPKAWVEGEHGIWSQRLDFDVWQLFNGDELVYLARWPDASFEDGSMWRMARCMRSADGGYDKRKKAFFGRCREGLIADAAFGASDEEGGFFREGDSRYEPESGQETLAESGRDFTGAIAMLNIGHWLSWARPITRHGAGADGFEYDPQGELPLHRYFAWYVRGLAALDRPNEWWFDHETKTVYYMPPRGVDPNTLPLEGRVRDFAVSLTDCADLRFENLTCFGGAFWLKDCHGMTFEDCRFLYAATHKIPLNELGWFKPHNRDGPGPKMPSVFGGASNAFVNCEFGYCNSPIFFGGEGDRIENCSFHDIEWDLLSDGASGSVVVRNGALFLRNTVFRTGNSEGVRSMGIGPRIELTHLYDMGNLQHDGAAINVGTGCQMGTVVARNWAHDCNRQGVRFDYHGSGIYREDGKIHGDGVYMRNVSWRTQPNQVKGDRHLVLNNTVVSVNHYPDPATEGFNMVVQGFKCMHEIEGNADSLTRNNLANLAHRGWNLQNRKYEDGWWVRSDGYKMPGAYVLPGQVDHNVRDKGGAYTYLRDPANWDFRPKPGSPLVDGGAVVKPHEVKSDVITFEGLTYNGAAPDVGAYESGNARYWIPGCKQKSASTPVPCDGAVDVPLDADLMFLEAYKSERHAVYLGESPNRLKRIRVLKGTATNIVAPPVLGPDRTYYWRVDATLPDKRVIPSPVWSFRTEER